eukprot:gb/GEZN01008095.1/.p1 GENE.gb/GEZN01008095.1/~~gb/GEZN01008095.1/.p1  ORF type:complete len:386 (+),score=30.96 gb/GEZN01008095.1/:158-1315(+)
MQRAGLLLCGAISLAFVEAGNDPTYTVFKPSINQLTPSEYEKARAQGDSSVPDIATEFESGSLLGGGQLKPAITTAPVIFIDDSDMSSPTMGHESGESPAPSTTSTNGGHKSGHQDPEGSSNPPVKFQFAKDDDSSSSTSYDSLDLVENALGSLSAPRGVLNDYRSTWGARDNGYYEKSNDRVGSWGQSNTMANQWQGANQPSGWQGGNRGMWGHGMSNQPLINGWNGGEKSGNGQERLSSEDNQASGGHAQGDGRNQIREGVYSPDGRFIMDLNIGNVDGDVYINLNVGSSRFRRESRARWQAEHGEEAHDGATWSTERPRRFDDKAEKRPHSTGGDHEPHNTGESDITINAPTEPAALVTKPAVVERQSMQSGERPQRDMDGR